MAVKCPVCSATDCRRLGKRSDFRPLDEYAVYVHDISVYDRDVHLCTVCGLQFIDPIYDSKDLDGLYNQEGYEEFLSNTHLFESPHDPGARGILEQWKSKFLAAGVDSWLKGFRRSNTTAPTFLDVGCGRGHNSLIFKELGFEVTGIDLSEIQIRYVRTHLGLSVKKASLEDLDTAEKFDCILAAHVIEHVTNPHAFMVKLADLLAPGGVLLIETPLTNDWGIEQHRYRDIYHTLFFDHFSLALLAGMHGFQYRESMNVIWKADSDSMDMLVSFDPNRQLSEYELPPAQIRHLRACHDAVHKDYLRLARYYLGKEFERSSKSILRSGLAYWRKFGSIAAAKRTVLFLKDRYLNRVG
ncbi:MAG: methyltransferase domain-containing protein [Desulfomonile tiedjei]|nr:methyltransferase domain-containing protein [Desulfomonile tiedjei]